MSKRNNLVGKQFGKLVVEKYMGSDKHRQAKWLCRCSCGGSTVTSTSHLNSGHTQSCGCYKVEIMTELLTIHGMDGSRFHTIWKNMKQRCSNKNASDFEQYGGRGITYCDMWKEFLNFKEDMYESYLKHVEKYGEKDTTIDRINYNDNYYKENCRWATIVEQANNKRSTIYAEYNGKLLTLSEISRISGIKYTTLYARYRKTDNINGRARKI